MGGIMNNLRKTIPKSSLTSLLYQQQTLNFIHGKQMKDFKINMMKNINTQSIQLYIKSFLLDYKCWLVKYMSGSILKTNHFNSEISINNPR